MGEKLGNRGVLLRPMPDEQKIYSPMSSVHRENLPENPFPAQTLRLVLGDQLNPQHPWFTSDPQDDVVYVLAEMRHETDNVRHHIQKIAAFFAAMEHFARELQNRGHRVDYRTLDHPDSALSFGDMLQKAAVAWGAQHVEYLEPDDYALDQHLRSCFGPPADSTHHFLFERTGVADHFGKKPQRLLESFYRMARKKHGVLMDSAGNPLGGQWNFDAHNRGRMPKNHPLPDPCSTPSNQTEVVERIQRHGIQTLGTVEAERFPWPVTHSDARKTLDHFVEHLLPLFGTYQDHLGPDHPYFYHSRLSFSLNSKLLHPMEVIRRVEEAHLAEPDLISLAQAEGFIRQILGWREFVRGIYWEHMPDYGTKNALNHHAPLPAWFWNGNTRMACVRHAVQQSLEHAYAHHIQRLMVLGNVALLLGTHPDEVDAWYLGIYVDALSWVEMPNTRGMSQFADGGIVGTKPYVSTGQYLKKQSHYCGTCHYRVEERVGEKACPLNALYWEFHHRHRSTLGLLPRLGYTYPTWDKMDPEQQNALLAQAAHWHENRDTL
jgi:deoxyribodipyrimidine photolyase-related protein